MPLDRQIPRACENCRVRKIKCDREFPQCRQCTFSSRSVRLCSYQLGSVELVFQDQTQRTINKHRGRSEQPRYKHETATGSDSTDKCTDLSIRSALHQDLNISQPLGTTNLVLAAGRKLMLADFPHGVYYQYLPGVYLARPGSSGLTASVESIGLTVLSVMKGDSQLMLKAREKHVSALSTTGRQISRATYGPSAYASAASILLLALFAVMNYDNSEALEIWVKHVHGAFTIMVACEQGRQKLPTPTVPEQKLISHVINCIQLSCFQRQVPIPVEAFALYSRLSAPRSQMRFHAIINELYELRYLIDGMKSVCISRALMLDQALAVILEELGAEHPFQIVRPAIGREEPLCHVYESHRACQSWNFTRVLRLNLNILLLEYIRRFRRFDTKTELPPSVKWQPSTTAEIEQNAMRKIAATAFDICASIPSFLRVSSLHRSCGGKSEVGAEPDITHWCHSLIWPLAMVQECSFAPGKLVAFIDNTVPVIWSVAGYPHDRVAEKQYMEGRHLKDWAHIFFWC